MSDDGPPSDDDVGSDASTVDSHAPLEDAGPLVPWATLDQDRFERLVEALVAYQHPKGSRVDAIDGRGGDGGVDVSAVEPDPETGQVVIWRDEHGRIVVYQLKYFREGFSGPFRDRRKQIKRSLKRALKTTPTMAEWVLVAPCRLTTGDRTFLETLREQHPDIAITFVGRADLDGDAWVAGHPDVAHAIVHRDESRANARDYGVEASVLSAGVPDLITRQTNLNRVTDHIDPHWTMRVVDAPGGGSPTVFLHAKHPAAPEVSPISVGFDVDRSSPAGAAFVKKQEFGLMEPAQLPADAVRNFTVTGPEFVVNYLNQGELAGLEVHPDVDREPLSLTLSFLDAAGHTHKSVRGQVRKAAVGPRGATVRQEFFEGAVVIDWRMPTNSSLDGGADVTQDLSGTRSPEDVRDALALVLALHDLPQHMKLTTADGSQLARLGFDEASRPQMSPAQQTERRKLHEVADDLAALQGRCDRQFEFPESVTALDRINARILRRLLEGRVVCDREAQVLHLNVGPEALDDPGFQRLTNGGSQLMFERESFQWTIDAVKGQGDAAEVFLSEPLGYYFPELVADNADEVIAALRRGENARLDLRSPSKLRPRLFLRDRLSPQQRVVPEPWGLLEIPEVPELQGRDDDVAS